MNMGERCRRYERADPHPEMQASALHLRRKSVVKEYIPGLAPTKGHRITQRKWLRRVDDECSAPVPEPAELKFAAPDVACDRNELGRGLLDGR